MGGTRNEYTEKQDSYLVQYIGKYCPGNKGRSGKALYERLVADKQKLWPWSKAHTAQSWQQRYVKHKSVFDERIARWQAKHTQSQQPAVAGPSKPPPVAPSKKAPGAAIPRASQTTREPFTLEDELHLVKYLAVETSDGKDRMGNDTYQKLCHGDNAETFPWAARHPWSSWRERYKKHRAEFDEWISNYQERFEISPEYHRHEGLFDRLPEIQEEDILPREPEDAPIPRVMPSEPKQGCQRSKETARQGQNVRKRGRKAHSDTGSETEPETDEEVAKLRKAKKRQAKSQGNGDDERRKRRKVEEQKAIEARREEEEESEDGTPAPRAAIPDNIERKAHLPPTSSSAGLPPQVDPQRARNASTVASEAETGTSTEDAAVTEALLLEEPHVDRETSPMQIAAPIDQNAQLDANMDVEPYHSPASPRATQVTATQTTSGKPSPVIPTPETHARLETYHQVKPELSQGPTPPTSDAAISPGFNTTTKVDPPTTKLYDTQEQSTPSSSRRRMPPPPPPPRPAFVSDDDGGNAGLDEALPRAESSVPRKQVPRKPPVRVQGAFNNALSGPKGPAHAYKQARRRSGVESDSESELEDTEEGDQTLKVAPWPPVRTKAKGKTPMIPAMVADWHVSTTPVARVNTVADPPAVMGKAEDSPARSPQHRKSGPPVKRPLAPHYMAENFLKDIDALFEKPTDKPKNLFTLTPQQPEEGPSKPRDTAPTPAPERRHTLPTPAVVRLFPPIAKTKKRVKPRHSMPAYLAARKTDGEEEEEEEESVSNAMYDGRLITNADLQMFLEDAVPRALQRLSDESGFTFQVVRGLWKQCGTIAATKAVLDSMEEGAIKNGNKVYDEKKIAEQLERRERGVSRGPTAARSREASRAITSSPVRRASNYDEYWPPDNSKAAILVRKELEAGQAAASTEEEEEESSEKSADDSDDSDEDDDDNDDPKALQARRLLGLLGRKFLKF